MEAVGATAAIIQLLGLCSKCGLVATDIIRAYHDTPRELLDLVAKLDIIRFRMQQLASSQGEGSNADMDALFPELISDFFVASLDSQYQALLDIKNYALSTPTSLGSTKLRWAFVNRRKAQRVIKEIRETNAELDSAIALATFRFVSFQQVSVNAIQASQAALLPAFQDITNPIRSEVSEIRTMQSALLPAMNKVTDPIRNDLAEILASQSTLISTIRARNEPMRSDLSQIQSSVSSLRSELATLAHKRPRTNTKMYQEQTRRMVERQRAPSLTLGAAYSRSLRDSEGFETSPSSTMVVSKFAVGSSTVHHHTTDGAITGAVIYQESDQQKSLRFRVKARLRILRQQIIEFELAVRLASRYWHLLPSLECRTTIVNVRSYNAEIFNACYKWDLGRVKTLFDCHEASINDVDDVQNAGLLEHATKGRHGGNYHSIKQYKMVQYLLHHGCTSKSPLPRLSFVPSLNYTGVLGPAIFNALYSGKTDIVRLMLQHNLTFDTNITNLSPERFLCDLSPHILYEQVGLLRSLGCDDWAAKENSILGQFDGQSTLTALVNLGLVSDTVYGLEVLQVDINDNHGHSYPLVATTYKDVISVAAVLRDYGAIAPPRAIQVASTRGQNDAVHWLLFQDVTSEPVQDPSDSAWDSFWQFTSRVLQVWHFEFVVRLLQHTLLHGERSALKFESSQLPYGEEWYYVAEVRAHDVARMWSYSNDTWYGCVIPEAVGLRDTWRQLFETSDEKRSLRVAISYTKDGWVRKSPFEADSDTYSKADTDESRVGSEDESESISDSEDEIEGPHESPFRSPELCALWERITSDEEGRKHLSRYPMVKALCCALQLSGYRAEMDSDGDIWYEIDDGDPYYDCPEHPPAPSAWQGVSVRCEICADPRRFGLGHILDEEARGLQEAREARIKLGKERPGDRR